MGKNKPVSLAAIADAEAAASNQASLNDSVNTTTLQRENVVASQRRQANKHTSLYLPAHVQRAIKEIAFQFDKKPHDLYLEGIDLMLAKYGKPGISSPTDK